MAVPLPALPTTLPNVAAMPGDVRQALPALTVMLVNGGINILIAVVILVAGWAVARWLARWVRRFLTRSPHIDETLKPLIVNFVRYSVLAITLVAVLSQFGVQTTSLIALLGATGLAIGLALQGTLSNVASGVMLLFLRPFRVSETITINNVTGTVHEIGLFQTELVTPDGLFVSIPNSMLFSGIVVNASRMPTRRVDVSLDIDRSADINAARKAVLEVVMHDKRVLPDPAPQVIVDNLSGPQVGLTLQVWVRNADFGSVLVDLRIAMRQTLTEAGFSPPIPVLPAPVQPWQASEQKHEQDAAKPN